MPGKVYNNPTVKIGTVDLSAWATTATVEQSLDPVDITTFGAQNKVMTPGLGDASITIEFMTDYATSGPNQTLKTFFDNSRAGTAGSIEIIPIATTVSASNPRINMPAAFLMNYTGFDGQISDASKFTAKFDNGGTAGITWGTV